MDLATTTGVRWTARSSKNLINPFQDGNIVLYKNNGKMQGEGDIIGNYQVQRQRPSLLSSQQDPAQMQDILSP